jgi:imidazolonepropionase
MAGVDLLVRGIGRLLPMSAPPLADAAVLVRAGRVAWVGPERDLPGAAGSPGADVAEVDAAGACVVPGFVDAHTHLVFAGNRRAEFEARLAGERYDGGGIRTTVAATRAAADGQLLAAAAGRARAALRSGTTTMEIKSGYGLTPAAELRLLDLARRVGEETGLRVEATYLGAHVVPAGRDRRSYVAEVLATLPAAREHGARWCDIFCDDGAFSVAEAREILRAARSHGLGLRLHAEELARTGAAALAAELGCASADHLEHVTPGDAAAMAAAGVVGVLLPTVTLSLRTGAWGQAAVLRAGGVELALGTDCNPGTSWCESMPYVIQLAALAQGLPVAAAFRAATLGSAHALRRGDVGHLAPGAWGDLAVLAAEHEADLVAHLGADPVGVTVLGGQVVASAR